MTRPAFLPERISDVAEAATQFEQAFHVLAKFAREYKGENFALQFAVNCFEPRVECRKVIAVESVEVTERKVVKSMTERHKRGKEGLDFGNRFFRLYNLVQIAEAMQERYDQLLRYALAGDREALETFYIATLSSEIYKAETVLLSKERHLHNPKYLAKLQAMRRYTFRAKALKSLEETLAEENAKRKEVGLPPLSDPPIDGLKVGERLTRQNSHKLFSTPNPSPYQPTAEDIAEAQASKRKKLLREIKREMAMTPKEPPTPQFRQLISDAKEALAAEDLAKRIAQAKLPPPPPPHSTSSSSSPEQLAALEAARIQFDPLPKPTPPLSSLFPPNPTPPNPNQSLPNQSLLHPKQSEEV